MLSRITIPIALSVAALCGAVGGLLSWLGGANVANSIMTGFTAFGGTVTLAACLSGWRRQR